MNRQAAIVATLTESPSLELLTDLASRVHILEVRDDLVRGLDPEWLRSVFPGKLLYTLRSREEGGRSESGDERRHRRLIGAARHFDFVDLEVERDLGPKVLAAVRPSQRIVSWHGPPSTIGQLQDVLEAMSEQEAHLFKLVPEAELPRQEMVPLALLRSQRRDDLVAFASGAIGRWTRLIAPRLGAPWVYASATAEPAAPGQLSVDQLVSDYFLPELGQVDRVFGLVGQGIGHSLSPRLHNSIYRDLGLPYLYLPFEVDSFGEFWLEVVESGAFEELGYTLGGLSVTTPYKRIASAVAGASSPLVEWLGAANTLTWRSGVWEAESTDGEGVVMPLLDHFGSLENMKTTIVGVGGAGRAAAVALRNSGADVTLVNRDTERGRQVARDLRLPFRSFEGFDPAGYAIVVNATSLGMSSTDPLPIDPTHLEPDAVVVDFVYRPSEPTRLVRETRLADRKAIDGREVLVAQAITQFRLMTGHPMSMARGREIVGL